MTEMTTKDLAIIAAKNGLTVDIWSVDGRWMTGVDYEACRQTGRAIFFVRKDGESERETVEVL